MAAEKKVLTLLYLYQCLHQNSKKRWLPWLTMLWYAPSAIAKIWGGTWDKYRVQENTNTKMEKRWKTKFWPHFSSCQNRSWRRWRCRWGTCCDKNIYHISYIIYCISYLIYYILHDIYINIYCMWETSCKGWSPRRRGQNRCRSAYSHILRAGW